MQKTTCKELMVSPVISIYADEKVKNAILQMARFRLSMVVVIDPERGERKVDHYHTITHGDLIRYMAKHDENILDQSSRILMKGFPIITVHVNDSLEEAIRKLTEYGIKRIVVVDDDDNLAGVISQKDILRHGTMLFQPATPFALIVLDLITGIPIFSYQFPDAPDEIFEDIDLFGGTLKIMTSLIEEVLRTGGGLREIQKGNFTLIIEPGLKTVCVLVANRSSIGKRKRLQRFRDQFETDYHDFLVAFSGSHPPPVTKFRTADKLVHYHFHDIDEGTTPDIAARKTTE